MNDSLWSRQTLGGMQFWTDYRCWAGYRLQQNEFTKHWRVLDPAHVRQTSGNRDECERTFERLVKPYIREDSQQRVVILLHGLMRTPRSLRSMSKFLASELPAATISPSYASTRAPIRQHAAAFREIVESLPGSPTIDLVAHSMGNIVIRHAISDWKEHDPKNILPRFHRMVMLGPPNQGALIAKRLAKTGLFGMITGKGGLELGREWNSLRGKLATPAFPFAIVAGSVAAPMSNHPLLEGASDMIVRVEEAYLDGCSKFIEVPVLHSFLMDNHEVQKLTLDFLRGDDRSNSS